MKLEMICTGEEVLAGQIVDTNAAWFASTMMEHGVEIQRRVTVGDRLEDLIAVSKNVAYMPMLFWLMVVSGRRVTTCQL